MRAAVNIADRIYLDEDGAIYPITNFFDADADECDPDDALVAVAGEGSRWFTITLSDFEREAWQ